MVIVENIISQLQCNPQKITDDLKFSDSPGIYAFFFTGKKFPLENYNLLDNRIIYIGKTEKSQKSRDANTHFKTGKSGSSTFRKSIGALLSQIQVITPVIRSITDVEKGRKSHYKFDMESEEKISKWIQNNISVTFFEFPASKSDIDELETEIIRKLKPVLNLDHKNSDNSFKPLISALRKKLGIIAHSNFISENKTLGKKLSQSFKAEKKILSINSQISGKYVSIWSSYLKEIQTAIESPIMINKIVLDKDLFLNTRNRKNYSFNIIYNNNTVTNNIRGSAVARDLDKVLTSNNIDIGNKTFKLSANFILTIEK